MQYSSGEVAKKNLEKCHFSAGFSGDTKIGTNKEPLFRQFLFRTVLVSQSYKSLFLMLKVSNKKKKRSKDC